ncbi:unnamed protein product [Caenorhabditis nigoni]
MSGSEDNQRKSQSSFFKKLAVISTSPIYSKFVDLLEKIEKKEEEIKDLTENLESQNRLHGEANTKEKKLKKEVEELEEIHRQHPDWDDLLNLLKYFDTPELLELHKQNWRDLHEKEPKWMSAKEETVSLESLVKTTQASLRTAQEELSNIKKEHGGVEKSLSGEFPPGHFQVYLDLSLGYSVSRAKLNGVVDKHVETSGDAQMNESVTKAVTSEGPSSSTIADQAAATVNESVTSPVMAEGPSSSSTADHVSNGEVAGPSNQPNLESQESSVPPPDETHDSTKYTSISTEDVPGTSGTVRAPLLHKLLTDSSSTPSTPKSMTPEVPASGTQALPSALPADVKSSAGPSEPANLAPPPAPSDSKLAPGASIDDHPLDRDAANALIELSGKDQAAQKRKAQSEGTTASGWGWNWSKEIEKELKAISI